MSAALRGLNEGLQTGMRLGSVFRDARQRRALQEEAAKYDVAEQAGMSPEQIERAQAETMGLAQQDAQEFGLDVPQQFRVQDAQPVAPSFRVGGQDFATLEEATRAARPMRAEGLARVRERFGDVEEAEALRERADTGRLRDLQLGRAQREETAQRRVDDFNAFRAENPDLGVQDLKSAARTQFNLTDDQLLGVTANIAGLQENELKIWKNEVTDLVKGKSLGQIVDLYNTDDRFDPTRDIRVERRGGRTIITEVDNETGQSLGSQSFESDNAAQEFLRRQAVEPDTLADWLLKRREMESQIGLRGAQAQALRDRPAGGRAPTAAELTARANFYMNSDRSGDLTAEQALALAMRDLEGGAIPLSPQASMVDAALAEQEESLEPPSLLQQGLVSGSNMRFPAPQPVGNNAFANLMRLRQLTNAGQ